ncbi:putative E3 ubiquitin-protein ligase RHY1A, partial [Bienertia sinuspersici]
IDSCCPNVPHCVTQESEPHQQVGNGESLAWDINNRETVHGLSGRYHRNNRLPGSVLLARERLVQRLRGIPEKHYKVFLATTSGQLMQIGKPAFQEKSQLLIQFKLNLEHISLHIENLRQSLEGLTVEALSELQHEVFLEQQNLVTHPVSKASTECSICLENFVEGNELINLPCGHRFHTSCLYPWLQTCGECPYCRSCIMHCRALCIMERKDEKRKEGNNS